VLLPDAIPPVSATDNARVALLLLFVTFTVVFDARSHGYLVLEQEPPPSAFGTFPRCAGEGTAKSCNFEAFQLARFGQGARFDQVAPLGQGAPLG